jgi:hypothetical protein
MAKSKGTKGSKTKADASRAEAQAKASAATMPEAVRRHKTSPGSTDIRRRYMKSLLGDYLGDHRHEMAIKPKK